MENSDAYIWIGNYYYHYYWSDLSISLLSKLYLICAWTMRWQEKRRSGRNPSWNYNGQRHTTDPVSLSICLNHCYINGDNHWDHWYLLRFIGWFLDSISMHMYVCLFVWEMLMGQIYIDCGFPLLMMWTWIGWTMLLFGSLSKIHDSESWIMIWRWLNQHIYIEHELYVKLVATVYQR